MHRSFRPSAASFIHAFLFLGVFLHFPVKAQFRDGHSTPERFATQLTTVAGDVFAWYDAPVFLAYVNDRYDFIPPAGKPFVIETSGAEQSLARSVAENDGMAPGSINPFTIPNIIIGARLAHAAAVGFLDGDANVEDELRGALGLYKSIMYTEVLTQVAKNLVHRTRPDGSDSKSFFSGHSSVTFAAAAFLQRETDDAIADWSALDDEPFLRDAMRVGAASALYGWAGYVGYSRMHDGKHYLSDVLIGAAVGALIGNLIYEQVSDCEGSLMPNIGAGASEAGPFIALELHF